MNLGSENFHAKLKSSLEEQLCKMMLCVIWYQIQKSDIEHVIPDILYCNFVKAYVQKVSSNIDKQNYISFDVEICSMIKFSLLTF